MVVTIETLYLHIKINDQTHYVVNFYYKHSTKSRAKGDVLLVVCRNGANETGLYIGASILFDMINKEQQVDVVQAVKQIRKTRPEFIISQVHNSSM